MLDEVDVSCPYCGAGFTTLIDCSAGDQQYVEDCQVCCAPIEFSIRTTPDLQLLDYELRRGDD